MAKQMTDYEDLIEWLKENEDPADLSDEEILKLAKDKIRNYKKMKPSKQSNIQKVLTDTFGATSTYAKFRSQFDEMLKQKNLNRKNMTFTEHKRKNKEAITIRDTKGKFVTWKYKGLSKLL